MDRARSGGQARRLTSTPSAEIDPKFSPDGSRLAFTATVGGNTDVYVVPVTGGEPTRLTFHPGIDAARGWSPDGSRVLFASTRDTVPVPGLPSIFRLWSVAVGANSAVTAVPEVLPMPRAFSGSFSPDGRRVAYEEVGLGFAANWAQNQSSLWRNYRGGRMRPIRLITLADRRRKTAVGQRQRPRADVDRRHRFRPIAAPSTCSVTRPGEGRHGADPTDDFDVMNASATSDAIVYEQGGDLHLLGWRQSRRAAHDPRWRETFRGRGRGRRGRLRLYAAPCCRRQACAPPSRPVARSSRCRPRRARRATWRSRPAPTIAAQCGRRTAGHPHGCRTQRRVSADDCRANRRREAARDRPAVTRVLLRTVVTRWQAATARRQPRTVGNHVGGGAA